MQIELREPSLFEQYLYLGRASLLGS